MFGVSGSGKQTVPFAAQPRVLLNVVLLVPECGHLTAQPPAAASSGCCFGGFVWFFPFPTWTHCC